MKRGLIILVAVLCVLVGPTAALTGNEGPLTDAGLDQTVKRGTIVVLDATGSRDPDGTITSYRWTIRTPRGRVITPTDPTEPRTTFQASELGRYQVTVLVTDNTGASTRDTLYVTVTRNNADEPTGDSAASLGNTSRRVSSNAGNRTETNTGDNDTEDTGTDTGETDTGNGDSDVQRNDTKGTIDERGTGTNTDATNRNGSTTVEVVRYVAEDIDMDVTAGKNAVNNNKLAGASDSKTIDYTGIDRLVNAGNVFIEGFQELIFGRERQTYTFTTTKRSEAVYEESPKNDINGFELDVFSDGPAVGLNKEYVDFRRVSDKPIENADVYRVHVVVQGEKGIVDYIQGIDDLHENDIAAIDNAIRSGIEDLTHDYSSKTNKDRFGNNRNSTRTHRISRSVELAVG